MSETASLHFLFLCNYAKMDQMQRKVFPEAVLGRRVEVGRGQGTIIINFSSIHLSRRKTQTWMRWQAVSQCFLWTARSLRARFAVASTLSSEDLSIQLSVSMSELWPYILISSGFAWSCLKEFEKVPSSPPPRC